MDLHALIPLTYLIAAVTFVLGLKGLSGPKTAVNGNRIAAAGMLLAVAATFFDIEFQSYGVTGLIVTAAGLLVGGSAGFYGARVVKMTAMPQMIALFNGAGGGAAALVSILELSRGLSDRLWSESEEACDGDRDRHEAFLTSAFEQILTRPPSPREREICRAFLEKQAALTRREPDRSPAVKANDADTDPRARARRDLVQALFSHNDFITIH